jgi:hypothetical protein
MTREVPVTACLYPGASAEIELDVRRRGKLPDGRVVGLRVLSIEAVPASPAVCRRVRSA